jgi:aryl-alcohol dehydrogenase-like predicted oxidoreductase
MKLALGTVQFGLDYGISNTKGQVSLQEIEKILALAKLEGITLLDTAAQYGQSEKVLGLLDAGKNFDICTKLPLLSSSMTLTEQVTKSLNSLSISNINTLLFHDTNDLLAVNGDSYYQELVQLKQKGIITKFGVSAYYPCEIEQIIQRYSIDSIQVPANIFDQRFLNNDILACAKNKDIEVHIRSVFLQGLLLMSADKRPKYFDRYVNEFQKFDNLCLLLKQPATVVALSVMIHNPNIDKIIVGCCNSKQLAEIVTAYHQAKAIIFDFGADIASLNSSDENLILPQYWQIN